VIKNKNFEVIKAFGIRVREFRISQDLTQEELANLADVPLSQIGRIERGEVNVTLSSISAIAAALKIEISDLF
jgi:transcriptional regulator with XRE-family HTH domain